jgi:hypothetical protein
MFVGKARSLDKDQGLTLLVVRYKELHFGRLRPFVHTLDKQGTNALAYLVHQEVREKKV